MCGTLITHSLRAVAVPRRILCNLASKSIPRCHIVMSSRNFSSADETSDVILDRLSDKAVITLNRPKALHALSLPMIRKMLPVVKQWNQDPECKLVITKSSSPGKAFCAGGDVKAIAESKGKATDITDAFFREEYMLDYVLGTLKMPHVALLDGITMGGGCGISMHGPFRVATENTLLAMPETAIGLFPDVGGSLFLAKLSGKLGMFLGLTGYRLKGHDILKTGLATHFCAAEKIPYLEEELLGCSKPSVSSVDKILSKYQNESKDILNKPFSLEPHINAINDSFSASSVEEIITKLRGQKTDFATEQANTLEKFSPLSLKVTRHAINLAKNMNLAECLKMDMRIGARMMQGHDFFEGVRCLLVMKGKEKPNWKPATLGEVSEREVLRHFEPLPDGRDLQL